MICGNSKGVNNRHMWFDSFTRLEKGCSGHNILRFPIGNVWGNL